MFSLDVNTEPNPGPVKHKEKLAAVRVFLKGSSSPIKSETARVLLLIPTLYGDVMSGAVAAILRP